MIVLLKDRTVLTLKTATSWQAGNNGLLVIFDTNRYDRAIAAINMNKVIAVFQKDEDYIASIGADLLRNLK